MASTTKQSKGSALAKLIGRNVKAARVRLGLTQSELAEKLGLDSLTISRLETGVQMPTIERLNDTATMLQVSLPILVTDAGQTDIFGERVAAAVQDLPPSEKEFVHTFAVQFAHHWRTQAKRKTNT
jgi:transcriptional regulator with XRE-family HTH domain